MIFARTESSVIDHITGSSKKDVRYKLNTDFKEEDHPRDDDGKFGKGGGGTVSKKDKYITSKKAEDLRKEGKGDIVYAGTGGEKSTEITPYGEKLPGGRKNLFGGIFASYEYEVAESHGDNIQELFSSNHIDHDDLRRVVFYDEEKTEDVSKNIKEIIEKTNLDTEEPNEDEYVELLDYIMGDESIDEYRVDHDQETGESEKINEPEMGIDRFVDLIGYTGSTSEYIGEAGWVLQGLKGELARRLGYTSIGMPDEHGESVLVLPGSQIITDKKANSTKKVFRLK